MTDITTAVSPSSQFNIFTGILKAEGSEDEGMTLHGIASSTVRDLHGDQMLESAIRSMEKQINAGLTIFLNHKYDVPEDVAGSTKSGTAVQRGVDSDGSPIWDLDIDIDIDDENPRAVQAWRSINKKGTKLGLSIGANIPEDAWERNDLGRYDIADVKLLETSIVGIPANPRSWISKAVDTLPQLGSDDHPDEVKAEEVDEAPPADDRSEMTVDPEVTESCPTCGKGRESDDCDDGYHKDYTEEVAEETTEVTTSSADEALEADSDPAEVDSLEGETAVVSAAIESLEKVEGEVSLTHLQMAIDIAKSLHSQNVELAKEKDEALQAKAEAEREKNDAVERTGRILAGAHEVIESIKKTPLGRKTSMQVQERKLAHLEGIYGAEIINWLEKTND